MSKKHNPAGNLGKFLHPKKPSMAKLQMPTKMPAAGGLSLKGVRKMSMKAPKV